MARLRSPLSLLFGLGFALCLAVTVLPGCANYQLGTGAKLTFTTLYVAPVQNTTQLPQAVAIVSTQLREAFIRDGRVSLVNSPDEADATLTVTLTGYQREVLTARPDDTGLARKFGLDLNATATLRDNRSGKNLFEKRPLRANREIFTDGGQLQAEYQTLPLLAEALAQSTTRAVLDTW